MLVLLNLVVRLLQFDNAKGAWHGRAWLALDGAGGNNIPPATGDLI